MDLQSILIVLYLVKGEVHESEIALQHSQCMAASKTLSAAILGPRQHRPMVEMLNGKKAPMIEATCLPACIPDALGLEPLELLSKSEDA